MSPRPLVLLTVRGVVVVVIVILDTLTTICARGGRLINVLKHDFSITGLDVVQTHKPNTRRATEHYCGSATAARKPIELCTGVGVDGGGGGGNSRRRSAAIL